MAGEVERFAEDDIRIKDLILDDFFGYREIFSNIEENMIDRQATVALLEIYETEAQIPSSLHIVIKQYVAAISIKKLLPGVRTYIAAYERRSDVQREGYLTYYDQLNMLNRFEEELDKRIDKLRPQVYEILAEDFAPLPQYEKPISSNTGTDPVTYNPTTVGAGLFIKTPGVST